MPETNATHAKWGRVLVLDTKCTWPKCPHGPDDCVEYVPYRKEIRLLQRNDHRDKFTMD